MQVESLAKTSFPETLLTRQEGHDRQFNLLQDDLVLSFLSKDIFSPATGKASNVVERRVLGWHAYVVDVLLIRHGPFQEQQRNVVVKSSFIEILVNHKIRNVMVSVREEFVLCLRIPFTSANL